ncbi:protein RD3-like [Scyliorhinus canicula]|uniref:protein RD3-like n=1 Tax=Scyliorhinus canicula TaxID=7830 RepID=UPI0018F65572|nr:protein RD3-like [Scyliorhinus canicula]
MSKGKQSESMTLFEWMMRSRQESHRCIQNAKPENESLMMELIQYMKESQRLVNLSSDEQKIQKSASCLNQELSIQPEDQNHLKFLCSKIHPHHVEAVLCKCREVSAGAELVPQELINLFKRVLQDSINKAEDAEQLGIKQQWTKKHTFNKASKRVFQYKEEIPTISSYVDKSQLNICSTITQKIWKLPQCYSSNNVDRE